MKIAFTRTTEIRNRATRHTAYRADGSEIGFAFKTRMFNFWLIYAAGQQVHAPSGPCPTLAQAKSHLASLA